MKLNRFGHPPGSAFDPRAVVEKVCESFSGVTVQAGDQMMIAAEGAASRGAPEHVVNTLRRNQKDYGPAYAFEIAIDGTRTIQGRARRYDVTFLFADPLADEWRQRLLALLKELGPGRIEQEGSEVKVQ